MPMRMVTLIEVFMRDAIAEIIDFGSPYLERSEPLLKDNKIDFIFALNLHGRKLTIGDFSSHSVSINNVDQITAVFETLFDNRGFRYDLSQICDRWAIEIEKKPAEPIISDVDVLYRALARLFEVRHVLTHETPKRKAYDISEIDGWFIYCSQFMKSIGEYITRQLRGNVPLTQSDMNQDVGNRLNETMLELQAVLESVASLQVVSKNLLVESQKAWENFADKEADLHGGEDAGGSMYPMVWGAAREHLARQRIVELSR